jgi:hypothetical protein
MKHDELLITLFKKVIGECDLKNSPKNRILDESDYFQAYLEFCHNHIYYSRFNTVIKGQPIAGKYLNEKVNTWTKYNVFEKMFKEILEIYKDIFKSDSYHIDGKIITNKLCAETDNLGRNTKYKSKQSINLQTAVDQHGIPLGFGILKGSDSEISNMVNVLEQIDLEDVKNKKDKTYFTADAGYDSKKNRDYLNDKGYTELIWFNKRNIKDENIIKNRKMSKTKLNKYKKRHIVENYFAWIDIKIPRLTRIYDKKIKNYLSMVFLSTIDLIIGRINVRLKV